MDVVHFLHDLLDKLDCLDLLGTNLFVADQALRDESQLDKLHDNIVYDSFCAPEFRFGVCN